MRCHTGCGRPRHKKLRFLCWHCFKEGDAPKEVSTITQTECYTLQRRAARFNKNYVPSNLVVYKSESMSQSVLQALIPSLVNELGVS